MPRINLGTCCGSQPKVGLEPWYQAGGIGVDTALDYGVQKDIAAVLKQGLVPREKIFITTKIPAGIGIETGFCIGGADKAIQQVKRDISELGVKYVDLVLLHAPCLIASQNLAMWQGLEEALAQNLTRAIGVSNYKAENLEQLMKGSKVKPAVDQCHMGVGSHDDATIKYAQANGITYEAYDAMRNCPFDDPELLSMATAHNVSTAQVCLRWVLQKGAVMAVGTGANASHVGKYAAEDLDLYSFTLTDDEMDRLSKK